MRALALVSSLVVACTGESKPSPGPTAMEVAAQAFAPPSVGPQVIVEVDLAGASATEMEAQVVMPIEHALVGKVAGIDAIAWSGFARVTVTLPAGTEPFAGASLVREALPSSALPAAALAPAVRRGPADHRVLFVIADEIATDPAASDALVERVGPIPGLSSITRCGGQQQRAQVRIDSTQLAALGLGVDALVDAVDRIDAGIFETPTAAAMVARLEAARVGPVGLTEVAHVGIAARRPRCPTLASDGRQPYIVQIRGDDRGLAQVIDALDELTQRDARLRHARWFGPQPEALARVWPSAPLQQHERALAAWLARNDGGPAWLLQEGPEDAWLMGATPQALRSASAPGDGVHVHWGGGPSPLLVRLCGASLDSLQTAATRVVAALAGDATLAAVVARTAVMVPRWQIELDHDALARHGVSVAAVRRVVTLLTGEPIPLAAGLVEVVAEPGAPTSQLALRGTDGALVPLLSLVHVTTDAEPGAIRRIDAVRCTEVELDATDATDRAAIATRLQRDVALPSGVSLTLP
ncbi:MAG: efflux RND transporter permease subunit [Nannocystaceae bacterium]